MSKKIVILGGGVAGLSAAHELIERGFEVFVYELKNIPGGKARSINVPDTASDGRRSLPGEHGFRFFPRFYKHVTNTMSRIPFGNNGHNVFDNLTEAKRAEMALYGKHPIKMLTRFPRDISDIETLLNETYDNDTGLNKDDIKFFSERLWKIMTSCYERRLAEYEKISWWDFIEAENRSEAYQNMLAIGLTRTLVAAKAKEASARTGGDILLQLIFDMITPGTSSDRLLNGPTNDVWIDPWLAFLKEKGVHYTENAKTTLIKCDGEKITGATVIINNEEIQVDGDYYIASLPVEVFSKLITEDILKADPSLSSIIQLAPSVAWMNGIQFYLKEDVQIVPGHTIYVNSEWALTSVSQAQFWPNFHLSEYGDGTVKGILSVDISDWYSPGELFYNEAEKRNKYASECTREEVEQEVWHQLKKSLNVNGQTVLNDDNLHSWFLDPDIVDEHQDRPHKSINLEPLLVNKKDTWKLRPEAVTSIPNLMLASDYIRTYTDLATMEGANEAARRAVNGILDREGSNDARCKIWSLHEPDMLALWRMKDKKRFEKGLPWDGKMEGSGIIDWLIKVVKKIFNAIGIKI